ncbi:STAS-like domain-containing protein [Domibacillus mangrovi]|uniref:DUF4325 domain-containing protein n=1 Tax=Domibacillus mangrovi TaxID=1714354 RepID=A0A1Q5P829_9BACI|nr:STAS-like domain-containing protein [Domibacillus mangrovi]OKL38343.1 hypothetical protein BLL40_02695 [Domibacillus mangrovi]
MERVFVKDIINSKIAVSPEKGELLYRYLENAIHKRKKTTLSFLDVNDTTTAFLNKAIGNLYNHFSSDVLNQTLTIADMDNLDKYLLSKVITRAKLDIKTNENLTKNIDEVFENE